MGYPQLSTQPCIIALEYSTCWRLRLWLILASPLSRDSWPTKIFYFTSRCAIEHFALTIWSYSQWFFMHQKVSDNEQQREVKWAGNIRENLMFWLTFQIWNQLEKKLQKICWCLNSTIQLPAEKVESLSVTISYLSDENLSFVFHGNSRHWKYAVGKKCSKMVTKVELSLISLQTKRVSEMRWHF